MPNLHVTPAYGADYKSAKEALEAWDTGKDFIIGNPGYPTYINKRDATRAEDVSVTIRYDRNTKVVIPPEYR
jgi:hypothetical protein